MAKLIKTMKPSRDDGRVKTWKGSNRCIACQRRIEAKGLCRKCAGELEAEG